MNAVALRALQIAPMLEADRDRLVMAISGSVIAPHALEAEEEVGITALVEGWIFDVLDIADSLAAKQAELQATRARGERHVRSHQWCRWPGCTTLGAIKANVARLERQVADELAALRRGHR
jgi:hypothetical protein